MNEINKKRRKQSILFTMMIIISTIIVITSVIFTVVLIEYRTKDLIEKSDDTLFMAAELTREIIGSNYHDKIDNESSVTNEQFNKIVARNDDLCRRLNLQYLWSVLIIGDRIVFTSATHSDLTNPHSPCATFFETHSDPDAFSTAIQSGLKPSFSTFKNQWGKGRMVLIPRKDARGRTYIFGASVQLTEFNEIIYWTIITSIGIGLAVILCGVALALILARSITLPIAKLTEAANIMATGNLGIVLEPTGTRELQSLSTSLDQMRQGIQNHLSALRESEEKEKLEAQNRQLQKSESLSRMAGAIAHHFNNQLGVVIGNLEMAIDELPSGSGSVKSLNEAMQAAGKAADMSGLMLTYLGQTHGKHEPLNLSEVCLRSLPILRAVMPGKVALETDFPPSGPIISADANQIQQVLNNLITNAWEAVDEDGGDIHLGVKTVSPTDIPTVRRFPSEWQPQDIAYACLEVTDTGCGIEDKDIEKLFDPFFSSKFTGRGMGLAVVLGVVRAHGGVITVESEPGRGSAFRIFLPVSADEILRQPDKAAKAPEFEGGGTVLLVDDEEMVRNMAAAMLMSLGFTVLEAKDGVEAVELFRQCQDEIRFVLCDLTMPRMNGWETLTALRKLAHDIPVILSSGYDRAQVMAGDHPELPQVFLGKPYKLKGLRDGITEALISEKK